MSNKFFKENSDKLMSRYPRPDNQALVVSKMGTQQNSHKNHGTKGRKLINPSRHNSNYIFGKF